MLNDITLCHGEGNLGRTCALRNSCQRFIGYDRQLPHLSPSTTAYMLCRPTLMLIGADSEQRNAYRYYIRVEGS